MGYKNVIMMMVMVLMIRSLVYMEIDNMDHSNIQLVVLFNMGFIYGL